MYPLWEMFQDFKNNNDYYHIGGSLMEKDPGTFACSPWLNQNRISTNLINLKLSMPTVYCDYLIRQAVSASVFPHGEKGSLLLQNSVFLLSSSVIWLILSKINTSFSPISRLRLSCVFKCVCTIPRADFWLQWALWVFEGLIWPCVCAQYISIYVMFSFPDPLSIISLAKYIHFPHIFPICYTKSVYYFAYFLLIFFSLDIIFQGQCVDTHKQVNQNAQHLFSATQIYTLSSITFSFTYNKLYIHIQILPLCICIYILTRWVDLLLL